MGHTMPLYQSMLDELMRQIESGQLPENSKLPSEQRLGELYNVSRITVRRALTELENRKYIYKKQGQGSFVMSKDEYSPEISYLNVPKMIKKMGATPKIKLEKFSINVDGTEKRARTELGLNEDDYLYSFQYLYYADDEPVFSEKVFLPFDVFPMIHKNEIIDKDLIPYLAKRYELQAEFVSRTEASLITRKNRKIFDLNVGDPMVNVTTKGFKGGRFIYYSQSIVVGDLIMFIVK
ncbi:GntR family transcriptional regulator [Companilactobacillus sp. HBUAS59699]|uniref:GntR family transcriptional regulator n=1 Tax=Companilactobacillus sp. HBUAS59699 TaxID=3109358 RepID=UPI002FF3ECAF